jgi:hypothetical protein
MPTPKYSVLNFQDRYFEVVIIAIGSGFDAVGSKTGVVECCISRFSFT